MRQQALPGWAVFQAARTQPLTANVPASGTDAAAFAVAAVATREPPRPRSAVYPRAAASAMRLTFLLPYRCDARSPDRLAQLALFMSTMPSMLRGVECRFVVCEQSHDLRKFNRGAVLNAGFLAANLDPDELVCIHDIDLLPCSDTYGEYSRALPEGTVRHIGNAFKRYAGCKKYMGGVLLLRAKDFTTVNGFPNDFEGWGGEDDVLGRRLCHRFKVDKSQGTLIDLEGLDSMDDKLAQLIAQRAVGRRKFTKKRFYRGDRMYTHGLSDVEFQVVGVEEHLAATKIGVRLM